MAINEVNIYVITLLFSSILHPVIIADALPKKPEGLYPDDPNVISLNSGNFDSQVIGSSNAWYLQFYNSWCGHCVHFAPLYRQAAEEIKGAGTIIYI